MAPMCKLEKDIPSSRHFPPIFGKTIIKRTDIHDASSGKGASSGCAVHNLHTVQLSRSPSDGRDHGAWKQVSSCIIERGLKGNLSGSRKRLDVCVKCW